MVALVGIDGSGKTTQSVRLAAALSQAGLPARYGRNAGGRRWLGLVAMHLGKRDAVALMGQRGLLVVESALRWLAIARSLIAARLTGRVAVMDRYTVCQLVSLRVHDGGTLLHRLVRAAYAVFPAPTVMLFLDIPPEQAYRRVEQRGSDHEELAYLIDCRAAYLDLASAAVRVDASGAPDDVAFAIASAVWPVLRPELPVDVTRA